MKTAAFLVLVVTGLPLSASAQTSEPDALFLTLESNTGEAGFGGGGEAEWLHPVSPRSGLIVGGVSKSLAGSSWTYGTLSAFTRRRGIVYSGRVNLGGGRSRTSPFPVVRAVAALAVPIARRLYAEAEGQHARVGGTVTTVFKVGAQYAGFEHVSLQGAHHVSLSDATPTHHVSARADVGPERRRFFGGVTILARGSSVLDIAAIELEHRPRSEYFAGATVGLGRSRVTLVGDLVPLATGRLVRVTATLQVPLGRPPTREAGP